MKNFYKKIFLSLFLLFFISISASFAYFTVVVTGSETNTTITVTGGKMEINYIGGSTITVANIYPRSEAFVTKRFSINGNNTTTQLMKYEVQLIVQTNTFTNNALKYKINSETNIISGGGIISSLTYNNINSGSQTISLGHGFFEEESNTTHSYNIEIYFPETGLSQDIDQNKSFTSYIKVISSTSNENIAYENRLVGTNLEFKNTIQDSVNIEINPFDKQNESIRHDNPVSLNPLNNFTIVSSSSRRNLLINSEKMSTSGSSAAGLTRYVTPDGNLGIISEVGNGNWVQGAGLSSSNTNVTANVKTGDIVTFSVKIRSNDSTSVPSFYFGPGMGYFKLNGAMSSSWSTFYYTKAWSATKWEPHFGFGSALGTFELKEAKLELGSNVTPWINNPEAVPDGTLTNGIYKVSVILPNTLYYIDGSPDQIIKDNDGIWKIINKTAAYTFKGTEGWSLEQRHTTDAMVQAYSSLNGWVSPVISKKITSDSYGRSNRFIDIKSESTKDKNGLMGISSHNGYNVVRLKFPPTMVSETMSSDNTSITNALKTWLTNNETTIVYERNIYDVINLNETLQTKLNNIPSFSGFTYIYVIGADTPLIDAKVNVKHY